MQNTYTWQQERQMLTDAFARRMLVEHNLKEVTTQRQAKNGTRIFLCPGGELMGSYSSGYVRRCDSSDRIWQLNPKYKREKTYAWHLAHIQAVTFVDVTAVTEFIKSILSIKERTDGCG